MGKAKWWVCPGCQSLNDVPANKCYKCRVKKPAAPVLLDDQYGHLQSERRVGITVERRKVAEIAARDPIERQKGTGVVEAFDDEAEGQPPTAQGTSSARASAPPLRPIRDPVKRGIAQAGGMDWRDSLGPLEELPPGAEPQADESAQEGDLAPTQASSDVSPGMEPSAAAAPMMPEPSMDAGVPTTSDVAPPWVRPGPPAGMPPGSPLPPGVLPPGSPLPPGVLPPGSLLPPGVLPPGSPRLPWDPARRPRIITLPAGVPPPPGWLPLGPVMPAAVPGIPPDAPVPGATPPGGQPPAPGQAMDQAARPEADPPWPAEPGVRPPPGLAADPEDRSA